MIVIMVAAGPTPANRRTISPALVEEHCQHARDALALTGLGALPPAFTVILG